MNQSPLPHAQENTRRVYTTVWRPQSWRFKLRILFTTVTLALSLSACPSRAPQSSVHKFTFFTMGTQIDLSLADIDATRANDIAAAIETDFQRLNDEWKPNGTGALGRLNTALQKTGPAPVDAALSDALKTAREISLESHGLFDPAVGGLVALWGFDEAAAQMPTQPPPVSKINTWLKRGDRIGNIALEQNTLRAYKPGLYLDFGGFAKGLAVDRSIQHLRDFGVKNAIVNAGGDLRAIGGKGNLAWNIGIRDPRGNGMLASLNVTDGEAVFTSGDYERFFEYNGTRYHHIFDPRSGYPTTGASSVTVIFNNGAKADAGATALMVAGPKLWREVARDLGLHQVMLVANDGTVYITPELQARMQFEKQPSRLIVERVDAN